MPQINNPKALNLDGLDKITRKVTIGFKCDPKTKLTLANRAEKLGMTLSEFVENIIRNVENIDHAHTAEIEDLNKKISFYENKILLAFFNQYKGTSMTFIAADGASMQVAVKTPQDMYTILINSFKDNVDD